MQDLLLLTFLFMVAGIIAVPIASRLGLGSVLGYLIAGIALSPILNSLNVDALTEDPTRVRIIADVDGSTTSYDLPWSDTVRVRPIDVERGADLGL